MLLNVEVTGPAVASLGSPVGAGEVYTVVVRNDSADVAYGIWLTATHPSFFIHDNGDQLISSTGSISINIAAASGVITWTPVTTYNLQPGRAITLNFRLRATCAAQSGQRLVVGLRYNADPPPAPPTELNTGAINITTGRGNLVIWKEPALQNLGTPDFGEPITWTVKVQNTGLGVLYDAVVEDVGGSGVSLIGGTLNPSTTISALGVNEVQTFTVVGVVEACNLVNTAQAYWPCGNSEGDATITNPVESTASVLFNPQVPNVHLQVSSPITCPYCDPVTRTVQVTITNSGGPAGHLRLDSTFESDEFWSIVPGSLSADWVYTPSTGMFGYTGGVPSGTIPDGSLGEVVILAFDVFPQSPPICADGSGDVAFLPLYEDVCSHEPFTGTPGSLVYDYGGDQATTLAVTKDGLTVVASGDVFSYQVTLFGQNPANISGTLDLSDQLPSEFEIVGPVVASNGVTNTAGQTLTWQLDPATLSNPFTETLIYWVRAITQTGGVCGAGQIVENDVQAAAQPLCPGCLPITATANVETAIQNNEGISPANTSSGVYEACGDGFVIGNRYAITDATVVTWTGAVFTEALGSDIGGEGALPGDGLTYRAGSLSVTVNGVDYTSFVTIVVTDPYLQLDLSGLQAAGAPTQNLTLRITYTLDIPENALNGAVTQTFHDWTELFLPGVSDDEVCAGNDSFNQVLVLTISRGDLSVELSPRVLNRCRANRAVIGPGSLSRVGVTWHTATRPTWITSTTLLICCSLPHPFGTRCGKKRCCGNSL